MPITTTDPAPPTPGVINGAKATQTYGFMSNCTSIAAAVSEEITKGRVYWRILGVKVALYDELRERRMCQPSGVEWGWASTLPPGRMEYPLSFRGDWHYDAIFITTDVLEMSLRRSGGIPVGHRDNGITWRVNDPTLVVIVLGENGDPTGVGRDMWILSHLTYPLVWVMESFQMYKVGREGDGQVMEELNYEEEIFTRLAGLVDIHARQNKIMFVIPTKTRSTVEIGEFPFEITSTNRYGELDGENGPVVYDMDAQIAWMCQRALECLRNLRSQFSDYARPYFSTGFNWLEIDTIVTAILPRFHQRIEGHRSGREGHRLNTGAPSDILKAYGLEPIPGLTPESFSDYGGDNAVTAMDMRQTIRGRARRNPVVLMGYWSNMAEIAVGTGYGRYDVHNVENRASFVARMSSGSHDRLNRARFLRMLTENIKRSMGVVDTIAFPRDDPANMPYWPSLVGTPSSTPGSTIHWLASVMLTHTVKWSWTVNAEIPGGGGSLTGTRTISSMWRTNSNTEWG